MDGLDVVVRCLDSFGRETTTKYVCLDSLALRGWLIILGMGDRIWQGKKAI